MLNVIVNALELVIKKGTCAEYAEENTLPKNLGTNAFVYKKALDKGGIS